ncbi:VP5 [Trichosanthes kirilowii gokushovirus]|nr:VP5 [Trichosanthes kirilowii gokushovirus]
MTTFVVCAVRDAAMAAFNRPFFAPAVGAAIRSFTDEVNRKVEGNPLAAHPEDYELFQLGSWNDETAVFAQLEQPHSLGRAVQYVQK